MRRTVSFSGNSIQVIGAGSRPTSGSGTQASLEHLRNTAKYLMQGSIARNTLQTYNTALNIFQTFRKNYHLDLCWPTNSQHLIMFIAHCFDSGLSSKSIKTYIAGMTDFHRMNKWVDLAKNVVISKLLEECAPPIAQSYYNLT